jgi:6-phosphogluconolactonase
VAEAAAKLWAQEALAAASDRGVFRVALSGGKTPAPLFRLLGDARFQRLPWEKTEVYWVDERCVPHDHAGSNYRLARELLLDHVPVPKESIHPMPTASGDPARDAAAYEATLRRAFPGQVWPRFDLIILGLGEDGHTASLFPGAPAVSEQVRWVTAARSPQGIRDRLTWTIPSINAARLKLFLVCGEGKSAILKKVIDEPGLRPPLSAQLITDCVALADRAAAPWLGARA